MAERVRDRMTSQKKGAPGISYPKRRITRVGGGSTMKIAEILDTPEAAEYLGVTVDRVRQLVWSNDLPPAGTQGRYLFHKADLDRLITRHRIRQHLEEHVRWLTAEDAPEFAVTEIQRVASGLVVL